MRRNLIHLSLSVMFAATIVCVAGCRGRGLLPAPGPMGKQQASAIVHDPFPQNDIAPHELASRPPDYQQPLPEPVRARLIPDAMPWLGR